MAEQVEPEVKTNRKGAFAILVGETLYLPSGRAVPYEGDVAAEWTPCFGYLDDPSACTVACQAVAAIALGKANAREAASDAEEAERREARARSALARAGGGRSKIRFGGERVTRASLSSHNAALRRSGPEFYERCGRAADRCDEIPEAGEEFARSVKEKLLDMQESVEKGFAPSDKMWEALENMEGGINRWLENRWENR